MQFAADRASTTGVKRISHGHVVRYLSDMQRPVPIIWEGVSMLRGALTCGCAWGKSLRMNLIVRAKGRIERELRPYWHSLGQRWCPVCDHRYIL